MIDFPVVHVVLFSVHLVIYAYAVVIVLCFSGHVMMERFTLLLYGNF